MNNLKAMVLPAVLALGGCSWDTTLSVGVGQHIGAGVGEFGDGVACSVSVRQEHESGLFVEYDHVSMCFRGAPFNDKTETWTDTIRVGKTWLIREGK